VTGANETRRVLHSSRHLETLLESRHVTVESRYATSDLSHVVPSHDRSVVWLRWRDRSQQAATGHETVFGDKDLWISQERVLPSHTRSLQWQRWQVRCIWWTDRRTDTNTRITHDSQFRHVYCM